MKFWHTVSWRVKRLWWRPTWTVSRCNSRLFINFGVDSHHLSPLERALPQFWWSPPSVKDKYLDTTRTKYAGLNCKYTLAKPSSQKKLYHIRSCTTICNRLTMQTDKRLPVMCDMWACPVGPRASIEQPTARVWNLTIPQLVTHQWWGPTNHVRNTRLVGQVLVAWRHGTLPIKY
jgi:hypothetical protein